jgi:membrane fusion protein, multidrug efflux system
VQLRRIVIIGTLIGVVIVAAILYRTFSGTSGQQRTIAQQTQSKISPGQISQPDGRAPAYRTEKGGSAARGPVPVVSTLATVEDFPIRRRTIGTFETPAAVIIRARVDSQVLEQHVRDGQLVKKGDLLFTLDDRELQAALARNEAQLAKDQAELMRTELDLQRARDLVQRSAAPQTQLETATAGNRAAAATVKADQAQIQADQIRLGYAKIDAPMDGRIGTVRVAPGNLVSASDTGGLTTLTQMQPLRVSFTLPARFDSIARGL